MSTVLCECQLQLPGITVTGEHCLHCGAPVDHGRWRCDPCQIDHDAKRDRVLDVVDVNRREASRARWGDLPRSG